jgi:TolB protein
MWAAFRSILGFGNGSGSDAAMSASVDAGHVPGAVALIVSRDTVLYRRSVGVMDGDGTDLTRLTDHPFADLGPSWSPDRRRLAFMSRRDGVWDIFVMNSDGSGVTNLTNLFSEMDMWPAWSPDGELIAFGTTRFGGGAARGSDIATVKANGTEVVRLTEDPSVDSPIAANPALAGRFLRVPPFLASSPDQAAAIRF